MAAPMGRPFFMLILPRDCDVCSAGRDERYKGAGRQFQM